MRKITIELPDSLVDRIEKVEGIKIKEFAEQKCRKHFDDARRSSIPLRELGIAWNLKVYDGLVKHVGVTHVSRYIRETIYKDLSRKHKDIIPPPEWRKNEKARTSRRKSVPTGNDRKSTIRQLIIPEQWVERIEEEHAMPGRYIKAVVQIRLEKETKKTFPVQNGMKSYLSHD